ncbi:MAG: hypothetical protein ACP5G1_04205, partial [Nanopusillaceae archaeon]
EVSQRLQQFLWLFGSSLGTLASVGIAPLVLSGIFMQLLIGTGIINIDITTDEGKTKFDNYSRVFAFFFIMLESLILIFSGNLVPNYYLNIDPIILYLIIFAQLVFGGLIIMLLDDFSFKYGLTPGINIIIFTTISIALALRLFNPLSPPTGAVNLFAQPTGFIPQGLLFISQGNNLLGFAYILAAIVTIGIIIFAIYLQNLKIEVPLLYINIGGQIIKYPIQLLYTSVIPAIFIYALFIEIQAAFRFDPNNIIVIMLSPPNLIINIGQFGLSYFDNPINIIHPIVYFLIFVIGGMFISKFWVYATGLDPKNLANILTKEPSSPLYARDPRIVESELKKYIDPIAYLSGLLMGLLASISDILSSAISGVSILLLVVIASQIYYDLERVEGVKLVPIIGRFLEKQK